MLTLRPSGTRSQAKARDRDRQAEQQARAELAAQNELEEAQRRSEQTRQEREYRDRSEQQAAERRRAIIQRVKHDATTFWWPNVLDVTMLKASVLTAIERELAAIPVEQLPHEELVLIAQGVRDRITREATREVDDAKKRSEKRESLIQHGVRYGDRELNEVEELSAFGKWQIRERIKKDLIDIRGDETPDEIEDLVDGILEAEGIGWDDGEDDSEDEDN